LFRLRLTRRLLAAEVVKQHGSVRKASYQNLLIGAVVGGHDGYDNFADHRDNYEQTEPATYSNALLHGI
jgi:hypothetical protein